MSFWRKLRLSAALASALVIALPFAGVQAVQKNFYLPDSAITIDGDLSEWGDPLINDGEDNPDRDRYCWVADELDWELMAADATCETVIYDELGQIDIGEAWFGVNEKNMLLAFTTATPMFSFIDGTTSEPVNFYDQEAISQLGIDHFPNDVPFSHDMVFSFDVDPVSGEESFDWYLVANLDVDLATAPDEDGGEEEGDDESEDGDQEIQNEEGSGQDNDNFLQIWQEEGTTEGFQSDEDTLIDSIDPNLSEVSADSPDTAASKIMEIRQNVEKFYEITGIQAGDEVGFRLETKSSAGDETKTVRVIFQDEAVSGLPGKAMKLKTKANKTTSTTLTWQKPKTGSKVTKYKIEFRAAGDEDRKNWTTYKNVKTTTQTVKKLKAKKKYEFRVAACSDAGCGDWTQWAKFQTKQK